MKKSSLLVLLGVSLILAGCAQQRTKHNTNHPVTSQSVNSNKNSKATGDLKSEYISLSQKYSLKYATYEEAVVAFKKALGKNIEPSNISLYVPGKVPREDGNPYFILDATTSYGKGYLKKDYCYKGWFSLVNDNTKFWEDYCGPIN
ncbi:MAG: hypothetical protein HKN54_05600 [Flavobacteriaceae bacterium]|nr:hypothetical protein [Flavobacteriaceae bacterium]